MSAENKKERKIPRPVWILGIVVVLAAIVAVVFFVLNPPKSLFGWNMRKQRSMRQTSRMRFFGSMFVCASTRIRTAC